MNFPLSRRNLLKRAAATAAVAIPAVGAPKTPSTPKPVAKSVIHRPVPKK